MSEALLRAKRHRIDLSNVGLRAQATAAGLVALCVELRCAGVLSEDAIDRVKSAIAEEIILSVPRHVASTTYRTEVRTRLDRIFRGEQEIGPALNVHAGSVALDSSAQSQR